MYRGIAPSLVEESARPVQVLEVVLIRLAPPKIHITNLEIAPKMARAVPMGFNIMVRPSPTVFHPLLRTVRM